MIFIHVIAFDFRCFYLGKINLFSFFLLLLLFRQIGRLLFFIFIPFYFLQRNQGIFFSKLIHHRLNIILNLFAKLLLFLLGLLRKFTIDKLVNLRLVWDWASLILFFLAIIFIFRVIRHLLFTVFPIRIIWLFLNFWFRLIVCLFRLWFE